MLARHGTVSAAAEALGVHRATVNRHVDTLEAEFQTRLFQRHARGYTLTESGHDMLDVAARADDMFTDLAGRNRGDFHVTHPQIELEFLATSGLARLEHGEAHVAFRAGPKPETPDYVVKLFHRVHFGIYASRDYIRLRGQPDVDDLSGHTFVGTKDETSRLPLARWMQTNLGDDTMLIKVTDPQVSMAAVTCGLGIGFLADHDASQNPNLIPILPPSEEWSAPIWTVTHVDLHRTEKVQEFLKRV